MTASSGIARRMKMNRFLANADMVEMGNDHPPHEPGNIEHRTSNIEHRTGITSNFAFAALLIIFLVGTTNVPAETILLQNAVVHTVSGDTFTNGSVLINGDRIERVIDGKNTERVVADKTIDLKGRHLYPGLIALDSALGLSEIEAIRATQDTTEVGEFTPDVQSWIAVNPDSELLPVARANGITHIEPAPQGGVVAGMSGVLALDGWTTEEMTIKHPAALHVYWPEMELNAMPKEKWRDKSKFKSLEEQARERQTKIKELDDFFQEARAYAKGRAAIGKDGVPADPGINPPWEAMLPAARGEVPLMLHANDLRQIKAAVKWAQTNDYKMILVGGRDAWLVADLLAARKIPVIYEFTFNQPRRDFDSYDVNFKAPEVLRKAGVTVAFSIGSGSFSVPLAKNLPYDAAQAVAFGLPEGEALKGLTLYPAQLLGVDKRLGSIEPGKEATLFVCDGDILDIRANVKQLWIAGREISLESRHTRLYEKYKNRPLPK
ncbi:MAG: Amidohydrolase [Pedosphaera sp.]|nr:Amidohydrolase [Pedosphaera sp.]